jgi:hypothetical protein
LERIPRVLVVTAVAVPCRFAGPTWKTRRQAEADKRTCAEGYWCDVHDGWHIGIKRAGDV